jgi:hypothetical protein
VFNNFNTNTSGTGVATRQPEEVATIGYGTRSGQAASVSGAVGGGGLLVDGGGATIGVQAGIPTAASEPPGSLPKEKVLCKTAGCSFYANPKLENLCTNCYEEYYEEKIPNEH